MPDPTTLTDEELDAQINNPEPDNPEPANPEPDTGGKPDPKPDGEPAPQSAPKEDPTPDPTPEPAEPDPGQHISRRESLRIKQVLDNLKRSDPQQQAPASRRDGAIDYATELDADPETVQRLQEDRQRAEQARYEEGLQQSNAVEWRTMLHIDAPQVSSKYPQLNKGDAENYHAVLDDSLSDWYLQMSGYDPKTRIARNPGMRYSDFVDGIFELAEEIASTKTASTQKNIVSQASNTAIRPDGSSASRMNLNKDPGAMSDDELDAMIALAIPKR